MPTRRERAWELLQQRSDGWTPQELAEALDLRERVVIEDLQHLQKSAKRRGWALEALPARCPDCGWRQALDEPKMPSKCPRCKATRLEPPRFRVTPR